jgi:hypothetical protein
MSSEYLSLYLFLGAVLGLFLLRRWLTQRRQSGLQAWALSRDYSYRPEAPELVHRYFDLPIREDGQGQEIQNVIRGTAGGHPLTGFDFSYKTTSDSDERSTTEHTQQVLAVELHSRLPRFLVTRAGLGARLAVVFGGQDVLIGHDEFDRAFRVQADDEEAVRQLLLPMVPVLLARDDQDLQGSGSNLRAIRSGTLSRDDLDEWIADLKALLAHIPDAGTADSGQRHAP